MADKPMLEKKEWKEFQAAGLLWWVNRGLHLFGWAIVIEQEEDGTITKAYPARCKFRGFRGSDEEDGFKRLTHYMENNISKLEEDING